jgi:acetylornithine deacetylase/succinyl-diaminopimelate desuccinylase-like protein
MTDFTQIDRYLETHLDESLDELAKLCAQPSVSAQNWGLQECAVLVGEALKKRGFSVDIYSTDGAPVVMAERSGKSDRTLLFYNHYDVQPAEPLDLWETPPFDPTIRNGRMYARGVSDDKGPFYTRLFAIDAILDADGELPCNVKFSLEGEEETSSVHLEQFVRDHSDLLAADACVWEFGGVDFRERAMQYLGLRGIMYVELSIETATQDVHSGIGGSIFPNSAWRLVWALNSLKGRDEKIRIPGFYDDVKPPTQRDIDLMALLPDEAEEFRTRYGIQEFLGGVKGGLDLALQEVFQPTCTICGLTSGYQGPGSKTVLPAKASAKIDFRLVPDQRPEKIVELLRAHLDREGFSDVKVQVLGGEAPAKTDPDDPFVKLVVDTSAEIYGEPMQIVPMSGGSGPNAAYIDHLHLPVVSAGPGHPDAQGHAPNENMRIDQYMKATRHITRILKVFGDGR